jgi:hypothetical protein
LDQRVLGKRTQALLHYRVERARRIHSFGSFRLISLCLCRLSKLRFGFFGNEHWPTLKSEPKRLLDSKRMAVIDQYWMPGAQFYIQNWEENVTIENGQDLKGGLIENVNFRKYLETGASIK